MSASRRRRPGALVLVLALAACAPAGSVSSRPAVLSATPAAPTPTPAALPTPAVVTAAQETARPHADVADLAEGRALRLLVRRTELPALPREGSASTQSRVLEELLAESLGLGLRWVVVPEGQRLVDALREGKGDLIGARHLAGAAPDGLAYTAPLRLVDEVVVCRVSIPCPATRAALGKRIVVLPLRDAAPGSRARAWKAAGRGGVPVEAARDVDPLELLQRVGSGQTELASVYRDELDTYLSYRGDVRAGAVVRAAVPVVWTARADAPALNEAANGLIFSRALSAHLGEPYPADLDEIRSRKVLRVGMLNNAASYFLTRGQETGFQYELAQLIARKLGVRLAVIVPERPADMERLLREERVDLIPVSPAEGPPARLVTSTPILFADHVLVQPANEKAVTAPAELAGRAVHVRATSVYRHELEALDARIVLAPEELETEELIARVGTHRIPLTVSNSLLLAVERRSRDDVKGTLVLSTRRPLVYAARPSSPALLAFVDATLAEERDGPAFRALVQKFFGEVRRPGPRGVAAERGRVSPYDALIRRYARQYGLDWRLVAAQMFQESHFDPDAHSWVGAVGLMQIMPGTAAEMGLEEAQEPESNVHAGVKYLTQLAARFETNLPTQQRMRFALAAYNAGLGHVEDARTLARRLGLDPNRWFRNVEKAMLLLESPRYHREARRGYCRGSEAVTYVSRIQSTYDAYARLVPTGGPPPPPTPAAKTRG